MRCLLNRSLWRADSIIHSLLRSDTQALRLLSEIRSSSLVLVDHERVWLRDHWYWPALSCLRLVLLGALEELQSITDLWLVETIRVVCWRSCASDCLLTRPLAGLIGGIVGTLGLVKRPLFIIVWLNTAWFASMRLRYVPYTIILLLLLHHRVLLIGCSTWLWHVRLRLVRLLFCVTWGLSWAWATHSISIISFNKCGWWRSCRVQVIRASALLGSLRRPRYDLRALIAELLA